MNYVAQSVGAVEYTNCISEYDIKQSDNKLLAWETWEMWSTPSLPLLPGPLWPGVLAVNRVLSVGQIEQTMWANKGLMLNCDCYIAVLETM